tara:strand:- start:10327 stop:10953 length:627 start_codon:yes stop_codon:yes gene_type:complete
MSKNESILAAVYQEYIALKSEQKGRIGFRDNLLYVTIGAVGTVISLVFVGKTSAEALLLVPWVTLVLGWTYIVNDEKVSAIGRYIRHVLEGRAKLTLGGKGSDQLLLDNKEHPDWDPEIKRLIEYTKDSLFGWEVAHRSDDHQRVRKWIQLIIDLITFVVPGFVCILSYCFSTSSITMGVIALMIVEGLSLGVLGWQILVYCDWKKGA